MNVFLNAFSHPSDPLTLSLVKKLKCSETVKRSKRMLCWGQIPRLFLIWSISVRMLKPLIIASPLVGV